MQDFAQFFNPGPGDRAGMDHPVADILVHLEHCLRRIRFDEVDLVGADDRGQVIHLGHDQKTVELARAEGGIGDGEDENNLIRIGDQNLLAVGLQVSLFAGDRSRPRES